MGNKWFGLYLEPSQTKHLTSKGLFFQRDYCLINVNTLTLHPTFVKCLLLPKGSRFAHLKSIF